MPRSSQEIVDDYDALAERFENWEPTEDQKFDVDPYYALQSAAAARVEAEKAVVEAVRQCRDAGYPWNPIGFLLGTTGEAARQRYGPKRVS